MERKTAVAKTVAFSPLRQANAVFRNILDTPYRLKWPDVSAEVVVAILEDLKRCIKLVQSGPTDDGGGEAARTPFKRTPKRIRLQDGALPEAHGPATQAETTGRSRKYPGLAVGINEVTRHCEKGTLRAGLVCLSAKPALLHQHLLMLAATRGLPFAALPSLSEAISPCLNVRSVLAVGFKTQGTQKTDTNEDAFHSTVDLISKLVAPIKIPWLLEQASQIDQPTSNKDHPSGSTDAHLQMPLKTEMAPMMKVPYQTPNITRIVSHPKLKKN